MTMEKLLWEVEKEALRLAFNKGGSWERYAQLKEAAEAAMAAELTKY